MNADTLVARVGSAGRHGMAGVGGGRDAAFG